MNKLEPVYILWKGDVYHFRDNPSREWRDEYAIDFRGIWEIGVCSHAKEIVSLERIVFGDGRPLYDKSKKAIVLEDFKQEYAEVVRGLGRRSARATAQEKIDDIENRPGYVFDIGKFYAYETTLLDHPITAEMMIDHLLHKSGYELSSEDLVRHRISLQDFHTSLLAQPAKI